MRDLYLMIKNKEALEALIGSPIEGTYFENEDFIVDFIGKIPRYDEEGNFISWTMYVRFNVRLLNEDCTIFDHMTNLTPEVPYRVFA